jgi:hypothetical protein
VAFLSFALWPLQANGAGKPPASGSLAEQARRPGLGGSRRRVLGGRAGRWRATATAGFLFRSDVGLGQTPVVGPNSLLGRFGWT